MNNWPWGVLTKLNFINEGLLSLENHKDLWIIKKFDPDNERDKIVYMTALSCIDKSVEVPLSQTWQWNEGLYWCGVSIIFLVNLKQKVMGFFFYDGGEVGSTNGPIFYENELIIKSDINTKLALTVQALYQSLTKAQQKILTSDQPLKKITFKFRFNFSDFQKFSENCQFPIDKVEISATKVIHLRGFGSKEDILKSMKSHFRNEYQKVHKQLDLGNLKVEFTQDHAKILEFYEGYQIFCQRKNLPLEPLIWFLKMPLIMVKGELKNIKKTFALILINAAQNGAHYLYGYEETLNQENYSLNFYLQLEILDYLIKRKINYYDLNGIMLGSEVKNRDHPFWGVNLFKNKFNGEVKEYHCPQLTFSL
jgi:hypothetical protein